MSTTRLSLCLSLIVAGVFGCGDTIVDVSVPFDAGELADAQPNDAGPTDVGSPDAAAADAGLTPCQEYCVALAGQAEVDVLNVLRDERGVTAGCLTTQAGIDACDAYCEDKGPSQACIDCELLGNRGCRTECAGTSLNDAIYPLATGLECWQGNSRPNESCRAIATEGRYGWFHFEPRNQQSLTYSSTASVIAGAQLSLQTSDGDVVVLPQAPLLTIGEVVGLEVEYDCPWWCETAYVLRSNNGALIQAGWSGRLPLVIPELALSYQVATCVGSFSEDNFTSSLDLELLADSTLVPTGGEATVGGYSVRNGRSVLDFAVFVTDHKPIWHTGTVEPR